MTTLLRCTLFIFLLVPCMSWGQPIPSSASSTVQSLYVTGTSVGNGADTTEDILQTYTLPANALLNVGDTLHVIAGGNFGATTDNKTARVRFGGISGVAVAFPNGTAASQTNWYIDSYITKTGASTQSYASVGSSSTNANGNTSGTSAKTDTGTIDIVVTGRNTTAATAGSITCQIFKVELIKAPGT